MYGWTSGPTGQNLNPHTKSPPPGLSPFSTVYLIWSHIPNWTPATQEKGEQKKKKKKGKKLTRVAPFPAHSPPISPFLLAYYLMETIRLIVSSLFVSPARH